MGKLPIYSCRKLDSSDLEKVIKWRMSSDVTKYMNTDPVLTLDGQTIWYNRLKDSCELYYWVVEVDSIPCGVINLADMDKQNKRCTWGYYVAEKKLRSFDLATSLEMSIYDYVFDVLGLNKISGESFCQNVAAIKLHEFCGCKTEGVLRQHIFKNERFYDICVQSMFAEDWKELRSCFEYQHISFPCFLSKGL